MDDTPDATPGSSPGDGNQPTGDDARSGGDDTTAEPTDQPAETAAPTGEAGAAGDTRSSSADSQPASPDEEPSVPEDVRKYERFTKMDGAQYDRVNEFLRDRTYITAREWAIARLCADFRTETGVEMTKIGDNLPQLVPFMTDTYSPQAVNQARSSFEEKVTQAGATFLYGAMSGFFTADELDDVMYEVTEVAKFLLEVEGVDLAVADELNAEERISSVMRDVRQQSAELRSEEVECPNCGHTHTPDSSE
jgi:hypothetical protein